MTLWNFIDEKKVLESLLKNKKNINNNTYQKIIVYIKHLKEQTEKEKKLSNIEIRNKVDELMNNYYNGFVMADWEKVLKSLVNKFTKKGHCKFRELKGINITLKELKFIKEFEDIETEKLLFVMLVLSKSYPYDEDKNKDKIREYWVNCDSNIIFGLSKFKYKKNISRFEQREYLIYDISKKLYKTIDIKGKEIESNVIKINKICDSSSIRILYADNKIDKEGINITIDENTMDTLVLEYLKWRGEKVVKCEECSKMVLVESKNPPKYCKECADEKKKERNRNNMKKARS